ncbi:MAG: LysE family transporter [Cyanobacteria bacterium J06642_2]
MLGDAFRDGVSWGLMLAIPFGPISVLCIQRTLASGRIVGLVSGLGAATADAVYGYIGSWGWLTLASTLAENSSILRAASGITLCVLGWHLGRSLPPRLHAAKKEKTYDSLVWTYGSTFVLTLANPFTAITFVALFLGKNGTNTNVSSLSAAVAVLGVFIGSSVWWLFLSSGISWGQRWLQEESWRWLNVGAGMLVFGYGVRALVMSLR